MTRDPILPGTGRWQREALTEGGFNEHCAAWRAPSTTAFGGGPPPRAGEDFSRAAARLAGQAGVAFGWTPDAFWRATPAELAALVRALCGEEASPPDGATIARMMEAFPDG